MNSALIEAVLLAWPPVVLILFRAIGPRRAVLVGLLGGFLFLPAGQVKLGGFPVDKWNVTGVALLLGVLLLDRRSLLRARPRWFDLPMALYYLAPLIGLATGVPGSGADILDVMIGRGLGWVVPYIMGRIYFGQDDGPATVAIALTVAGLSYIPVCVYEEIAGPSRYLAGLIYGLPYSEGQVDRLGGWRPEGFLGGLTLAAWMAMTAVMATWLWLGGWRPGKWPGWLPALALLAASLSCRGVYGYILLAIGIASALLTRWLRTRAVLAILAILPVAYMGLRGSGLWDGGLLVRGATLVGRPSTVAWRLNAEDQLIRRVIGRDPAFGFGNYVWHSEGLLWPDGSWLHALWMGGLVGLSLSLLALYILPAALALSKPRGRPDPRQAASPAWALAAWCLLLMIDGMHNNSYFTPTAMVAGALVGFSSSKSTGEFRPRAAGRARPGPRSSLPVPLIVTIILLAGVELLGRSRRAGGPPPGPPAPASAPRK
jgi:hypothetical protein